MSEQSDSIDEEESGKKRGKRLLMDPITDFKCKRFKVAVDGSINFEEYQIFSNINTL